MKSFFYFNFRERQSFLTIISILIMVSGYHFYLEKTYTPDIDDMSFVNDLFIPIEETKTALSKNLQVLNTDESLEKRDENSSIQYEHLTPSVPFNFDPNLLSEDSLELIGINKKAAQNLVKYREKGGKIMNAEDLQKIYGLKDTEYNKIKNYVKIEDRGPNIEKTEKNELVIAETPDSFLVDVETQDMHVSEKKVEIEPKNESSILIDINTADEVQLQYIKGIGPSFAKRIIKYRDLLGGFHSKRQLLEVYGLDHLKYSEIKDYIKLSQNITPMDINKSDAYEMSKHPYLSYQQAKLIVAYGKQHGPYNDVYKILEIGIMDSSFVEKLLPYIPKDKNGTAYRAQTPPTSATSIQPEY